MWEGKGWSLENFVLEISGSKHKGNRPTLLDGEYVFRKKRDTAFYVKATFENGYLTLLEEQFENSASRRHYERLNFTNKFNNYSASFYVEIMVDHGHFEKGYCYFLPDSKKIKCELKDFKTTKH